MERPPSGFFVTVGRLVGSLVHGFSARRRRAKAAPINEQSTIDCDAMHVLTASLTETEATPGRSGPVKLRFQPGKPDMQVNP